LWFCNIAFQAFPDRYIECFIAEQNLVGVAIGATCRDRTIAFVSTFATFFTRAFDQVNFYIDTLVLAASALCDV
jgi:transketolase C-terminal domain/subunit